MASECRRCSGLTSDEDTDAIGPGAPPRDLIQPPAFLWGPHFQIHTEGLGAQHMNFGWGGDTVHTIVNLTL